MRTQRDRIKGSRRRSAGHVPCAESLACSLIIKKNAIRNSCTWRKLLIVLPIVCFQLQSPKITAKDISLCTSKHAHTLRTTETDADEDTRIRKSRGNNGNSNVVLTQTCRNPAGGSCGGARRLVSCIKNRCHMQN